MSEGTDKSVSWWQARLPLMLVGVVFIVSALAKLAGLGGFERYLVEQGLTPNLDIAAWLSRLLIALELFVGLALFQRAWVARLILPATMAMLVCFSLYLAYSAFIRGDTDNCHCLGELVTMSPAESLVKNVGLLALCVWSYINVRRWDFGKWHKPVSLLGIAGLVTVLAAPQTIAPPGPETDPSSDAPSRFAAFTEFRDAGTVQLTEGEKLVAFVSLDCEHCQDVMRQLAEADRTTPLPSIYLICLGTEEQLLEFQFMTEAMYPAQLVEPETFFQFIGEQPPRVYLLRQGRVVAYWDQEDFSVEAIRGRAADDVTTPEGSPHPLP